MSQRDDELDDILKGAARENLRRMGISERSPTPVSSKQQAEMLHSLRSIADTIEQNGGWHIAALKVRAAAEQLERLTRGMNGQADTIVRAQQELAEVLKRCDELERANVGLATESERRRAALEEVKRCLPGTLDRLPELRERIGRALSGEHSAHETTAHLPGDGTRRAAFNAWWQEMWEDNDPRSSPGFDEQMRSWSLDAWQAGAAHERDRIDAMRSAVKASECMPPEEAAQVREAVAAGRITFPPEIVRTDDPNRWLCLRCGEHNDARAEQCWSCFNDRTAENGDSQ